MDKVSHFEIPADDLERAKKFYSSTFDWKFKDMPEMNYVIVHTTEVDEKGMTKEKGAINGGMMKRGKIKSPVITIIVESIEETLKKVEANGGKTIEAKTPVGEMGFLAYIQDSEQNIMGLFQPTMK